MALFDFGFERVAIPYEDTTLPGYLYLVDDRPRPTVIFNGGYDSTLEESYVALAAAALARGYHVLAFDGPGQGAALREQRLTFRHDWEAVLTPVVDFALTRSEIAPDAITVFGYSMGGFLVARAAAFEDRFAAVVVDDGIYDFHSAMAKVMPPFLAEWVEQGNDDDANAVFRLMMSTGTGLRWIMQNGMWNFGLDSPPHWRGLSAPTRWTASPTGSPPRFSCSTPRTTSSSTMNPSGLPRRWSTRRPPW